MPSRKKGSSNKEGREIAGKREGKEKEAGPSFLQRWLTASGGTLRDSLKADTREGLPGQKQGKEDGKELE